MDLCTLEDAFPNINEGSVAKPSGIPFVGGKDSYSSREERKAARKKAKKQKGPALTYSDSVVTDIPDPDRPAVERMESVASMQKEKEGFGLPVLPKASCLFSDTGTPKYFGKWTEDEDVEEPFSTFSPSPTDDANYRLFPDFTKSGSLKGVEKALGAILPEPPLNDAWKPMTPASSYTAFFKDIPRPTKEVSQVDPEWATKAKGSAATGPVGVNDTAQGNNQDALLKRIDELMGRLDQLEKKNKADSQNEILMFVGTGLFLLMSFELFSRR
jgi:hypothetical protein